MIQLIYIGSIISTVILIINRKKLNAFWICLSALIGLIGGVLTASFFTNAYLGFFQILLWCPGLPLLLASSNKHLYEIKTDNSNETCSENIAMQERSYTSTQSNTKLPLSDEAFTCYASFLTHILKSCQYDKCGTLMKIKLENHFLLYLALGKGKNCALQDFPLQQFLQQTETFVLSFGLENMFRQIKEIASENEITFCKTSLMNFANVCRKEIGSPVPMQQAVSICNAIDS